MALKSQSSMLGLADRALEAEVSVALLSGEKAQPSRPISDLLLSGIAYICTSSALILFNKHALASFHWQCPNALLAFHCVLAVILVKLVEVSGFIKLEPLRWSVVRIWFPGVCTQRITDFIMVLYPVHQPTTYTGICIPIYPTDLQLPVCHANTSMRISCM